MTMTRPASSTLRTWVLLSYRIPREPSTPRITIWRKLKRLGVAQLGDGLVALPADARTREQLDWIAEEITEAGGTASLWIAQPANEKQDPQMAETMAAARAAEYITILNQAAAAADVTGAECIRTVRRLRDELRKIQRRDYFPPAERDAARLAVDHLARTSTEHSPVESHP
jgi:DNA-binding transcriptional regulator PaaX